MSVIFVSDKQISQRYEVARQTVWAWVKAGHLPQPVKLSPGCTRWKLSDLEAWEEKQGVAE